jgi:pilus assembly protein FimV
VGKFASKIGMSVAACLFLPAFSWAAGLGKLSVISTLGQPLKAEIEIVSLQRGEGDTLTARLASGQAFRQANIEMNPALLSVQFAIERRASGQHVLTLASKQPINEPFIDMLVELNWANGRLVREYTFLLDPPEYASSTQPALATVSEAATAGSPPPATPAESPAPEVPEVSAAPEPAAPAAALEAEPPAQGASVTAESAEATQVQVLPADVQPTAPVESPMESTQAAQAPAPSAPETGEAERYEVKRGDTLSKIAMRNRIEGVSLQQMLVALFRANQEAFVADNMNRLRAGKIVTIPGKEAAAVVAAADARRIVSAQYVDFNDYRRSLGIAVASAPTPKDAGRQASGPISAPTEEKPAPSKEPPKDELRLSRADDAKRGAGAAAAAADDLAAKDNALREANERIALLEKNLQDLQKLVQLRSQTGSELQQQARSAKSAPTEAAAKSPPPAAAKAPEPAKAIEPSPAGLGAKADAPKPTEANGEGSKAQPVVGASKSPAPPEATKAQESAKAPQVSEPAQTRAKAPEAPTPDAAKTAPKKAAPKAAAKAAPPPPGIEVSFLDDLLDNPLALGGAGGAVLLLVGYAAYAWRRKRSSQFENSIMSVVPSDADSVLGSEGGRNVDTGSSSFQGDFSQGGISKMDTEEIDPIAEADVYMAYGRDAQAEEILKDALAKDSTRQSIRVKLLEIYANRKDASSFEAAASELHRATGGKGAEWEKVAGLGLSIDPANPLYGGKPGTAGEGFRETAQMAAFKVPETEPGERPAEPLNIDFDIGSPTSGGVSPPPDFNLDAGSPLSPGSSPAGLDFDLGLGADRTSLQPAMGEIPTLASASALEPSLSIDFDLPMGDTPAQSAPSAPATATTNLGSIDFDLGTSGGGGEATTEASRTPPPLDVGSISLDLGVPGGGNGNGLGGAPDARWQEVATKLDLAKAYEEMGDKDGARELLKEVMREGDMAQQQQAQTMLQALG